MARRSGSRGSRARDERVRDESQRLGSETVESPPPSLLAVDESGVGEDAKVMANRWLRHAHGGGEVAHACFRGAREKAHDLEAYGIGKDAKRLRHPVGLIGRKRRGPQRGATRVQLGDLLPHNDILTTVDAYVNISTRIDTCF